MPAFTKELVLQRLKALLTTQDLELYQTYLDNELEYWDGGNADDTFNLGVEIGNTDMLGTIIKLIEETN